MRTVSFWSFVLALGAVLPSQTYRYDTVPGGFEPSSKPGNYFSLLLGGYANGRAQCSNSGLRGKAVVIRQIDFRGDGYRSYETYQAGGRNWTNVRLTMSETTNVVLRTDWKNPTSTPTTVASAKMSWQTIVGKLEPTSAVWGAHAQKITFSTPWSYTGKADLLMDFEFCGGKLTNGRAWGSTNHPYYLDGISSPYVALANGTAAYHPSNATCKDGAISAGGPASAYAFATVYGEQYAVTSMRGKMTLYHYTGNTAPNANVIQVASLFGSSTGVAIPGGVCNGLHVDMAGMLGMTFRKTNSVGASGQSTGNGYYTLPFHPLWGNHSVWFQGAWKETRTGGLALTRSVRLTLPPKPSTLRRSTVFASNKLATRGSVTTNDAYQPLPRMSLR